MKCPHCQVSFHDEPTRTVIGRDAHEGWGVVQRNCPACGRIIIELVRGKLLAGVNSQDSMIVPRVTLLVFPRSGARSPPAEVGDEFASDYREAALVLADSPKASAALSRRCLQHVLREKAGIKKGDLADEIQQVIDSGKVPSHIADSIDAVRNIGNFAAHPIKSKATGEIVSVEPGEAEWNLDTLDALFDFYFVQPELVRKRRAELDAKLKDAGKPPVK